MSVRNLGFILDNTLGMEKQVISICKSCYYQIRNIGLICKYINDETCKTLVQALISSRLDYGNALLYNYNIPLCLTNRLQREENCAPRLVTRTHKREHITSVLFQLYWLPVRFRSVYKIMFHIFKVLTGTAPVYLSDLIKIYTSENAPIRVLFTFEGTKKPYSNVRREILPSISSQAVERVAKPHKTRSK